MTTDSAAEFFTAFMAAGKHVPRLSRCAGSVRFDVMHPDRVEAWRVVIAKGDVSVTRDEGAADAVVRGDKAVMDGIFAGDVNATAATLRGVLSVEGNWDLVLMCQRLFAEPVYAAERAQIEGEASAG